MCVNVRSIILGLYELIRYDAEDMISIINTLSSRFLFRKESRVTGQYLFLGGQTQSLQRRRIFFQEKAEKLGKSSKSIVSLSLSCSLFLTSLWRVQL